MISLLIFLTSILVFNSTFFTALQKNSLLLQYASATLDADTKQEVWAEINQKFIAASTGVQSPPLFLAQQAEIATRAGDLERAFELANQATKMLPVWTPCEVPYAYPEQKLIQRALFPSRTSLTIAESSAWQFYLIGISTHNVNFVEYKVNTSSNSCIAQIHMQFSQQGNHYIDFRRHISQLEPNFFYRITAFIRARGVGKAWLGIRNAWQGTTITDSVEWQPVSYSFKPITSQQEAIQLVIEGGEGILEIRDVSVEKLGPVNQ